MPVSLMPILEQMSEIDDMDLYMTIWNKADEIVSNNPMYAKAKNFDQIFHKIVKSMANDPSLQAMAAGDDPTNGISDIPADVIKNEFFERFKKLAVMKPNKKDQPQPQKSEHNLEDVLRYHLWHSFLKPHFGHKSDEVKAQAADKFINQLLNDPELNSIPLNDITGEMVKKKAFALHHASNR